MQQANSLFQSLGDGFFQVNSDALFIPIIEDVGYAEWTPRKSILGITKDGRLLTDGRPCRDYNGISIPGNNAKAYQKSDGWTILDANTFAVAIFRRKDCEVYAIGDYNGDSAEYTKGWERYAVRTEDVLPGCTPRQLQGHSGELALFLAVMKNDPFPCRYFCREGWNRITFEPLEPLSRDIWEKLGFWPYTRAGKTLNQVCRKVDRFPPKPGAILQFDFVDEVERAGFRLEQPPVKRMLNSWLVFDTLRIEDPSKASQALPLAAAFQPGALLRQSMDGDLRFDRANAKNLEPIPEGGISYNDMLSVPRNLARCNGNGLAFAVEIKGKGPKSERNPLVFATRSLANQFLIPLTRAAAQYSTPKSMVSYELNIDGNWLNERYVLADALKKLPSRQAAKKWRRSQWVALSAKYGADFPGAKWTELSDNDWRKLDTYIEKRDAGWVSYSEYMRNLGLTSDGTRIPLVTWMEKHIPFWDGLDGSPRLWKPMSRDEILNHPHFADLFKTLFGDLAGLAAICVLSNSAKSAVLADYIGQ